MANWKDWVLTTATASRSFGTRFAEVYNVKDYGAVGNGSTPDGAAIQSAFNAAYRESSGAVRYANKSVYIPAGNYNIDQQLFIDIVEGAHVYGDGQHQTRLIYTGPASSLSDGRDASLNSGNNVATAILTCRAVRYSSFQGIGFICTGSNANHAVCMHSHPSLATDGNANSWTDIGFIGASRVGFYGGVGVGALGSEQMFTNCTFVGTGVGYGADILSFNALNYVFINCHFEDWADGIHCKAGAINYLLGCTFESNSDLSFQMEQAQCPVVIGCNSTDPNFLGAGPSWTIGCTHTGSGYFFDGDLTFGRSGVFEACRVPSGVFHTAEGGVYLRGNIFGNAAYLDLLSPTHVKENI